MEFEWMLHLFENYAILISDLLILFFFSLLTWGVDYGDFSDQFYRDIRNTEWNNIFERSLEKEKEKNETLYTNVGNVYDKIFSWLWG